VTNWLTNRRLAVFGTVGPPLFVAVVILVTALEWDVLHGMGWDVLRGTRPVVYPSATAMGPYGWLQVLNFLQFGLAVIATAVGLWRTVMPRPRFALGFVFLAGVALVLSVFITDGTNGPPKTWHGTIHAIAFLLLLLSTFFGPLVLAFQVRNNPEWRSVGLISIAVPVVIILTQFVPYPGPLKQGTGLISDITLLVMFAWFELLALRLLDLTPNPIAPPVAEHVR
jgi:Protein of unknown function (DUF998)